MHTVVCLWKIAPMASTEIVSLSKHLTSIYYLPALFLPKKLYKWFNNLAILVLLTHDNQRQIIHLKKILFSLSEDGLSDFNRNCSVGPPFKWGPGHVPYLPYLRYATVSKSFYWL